MTARISYEVLADYGYGHGYEPVTAEDSLSEAKARLAEYRENEPGVCFKLVKVRQKEADDGTI